MPMYRSEKSCYSCNTIKPIDEFGKNSYKVDGRADACRECDREAARARRARKKQLAASG